MKRDLEYLITGDQIRPSTIFRIDNEITGNLIFFRTELGDILFTDEKRKRYWQLEFNRKSRQVKKDKANRVYSQHLEARLRQLSQRHAPKKIPEKEAFKLFSAYKPNQDISEPLSRDRLLGEADAYFSRLDNRVVTKTECVQKNISVGLVDMVRLKKISTAGYKSLKDFINKHENPTRCLESGKTTTSSGREQDLGVPKGTRYRDVRIAHGRDALYFRVVETNDDSFSYQRNARKPDLSGHYVSVFSNKVVSRGARLLDLVCSAARKLANNWRYAAVSGLTAATVLAAPYVRGIFNDDLYQKSTHHTVKEGDSLWRITRSEFKIDDDKDITARINQIVELNKQACPNLLQDRLYVDSNGRVRKGSDGIRGDLIFPGQNLAMKTTSAQPNGRRTPYGALLGAFLGALVVASRKRKSSNRLREVTQAYASAKTSYDPTEPLEDVVGKRFAKLENMSPEHAKAYCRHLTNDIEELVERHNKGISTDVYAWLPQREDVVYALNLARDRGYILNRFCYDAMRQGEIDFLVGRYKAGSKTVDSLRKEFAEKYSMKMSKNSFYKIMDKRAGGFRRRSTRK